jgi:hypothetical protein
MALDTMTNRSPGDSITASDWETIRTNIAKIEGTASESTTEGYDLAGQISYGSARTAGLTITDTDTNTLINAVQDLAVYTGATNVISDVSNGATIQETDLNNTQTTLTNIYAVRNNAVSTYLSQEAKASSSRTSAWSTTVTHDVSMLFKDAENLSTGQRAAFFNAGGSVYFTAGRSGGSSNDQNTDWTNMLSAMGTIKMNLTQTTASSGTTTSIGAYDLSSGYTTIYEKSGSGSYSTNYYKIQAKDVGGAFEEIRFLITFGDSHTGRGYFDSVDGTLSSVVGVFRPDSGTLPNGNKIELTDEFFTFAQNSSL